MVINIRDFDSDDFLLGKTFNIFDMIIVCICSWNNGKYYPQMFLPECAYMLQYEKRDVSEGIDSNKTSASKEYMLCHYWYFKDVGFKFESYVCNKCHDVLMTAYELKNIAILNVKGVNFRCVLWDISRVEAANTLNNSLLEIRVLYKCILVQIRRLLK